MKSYLLLVVLTFALISCKKTQNPPKDFVTIGNTDGLLVKSYQTELKGTYGNPEEFDIDVNSDGINDFRIRSEVWGSPGLGTHPRSSISCLHDNAELYGVQMNDTTFKHIQATYGPGQTTTIQAVITTTLSCDRISSTDDYISVRSNELRLKPLYSGNILSGSAYYKSDAKVLKQDIYSLPAINNVRDDTTFYEVTRIDNTCADFPSDKDVYIGVRLTSASPNPIGWIHIRISNIKDIEVMESAVALRILPE